MKLIKYLDVLEDKTILAILRELVNGTASYTGRQIAYYTGLNQGTCQKYLDKLVSHDILHREQVGKAFLYSIHHNYFTDEVLVPLIQQEMNLIKTVHQDIINRFSGDCQAIVIYGSYARKQARADSDLDLCFMLKGSRTAEFEAKLDQFVSEMSDKFGLYVEPYVLTPDEIIEKKQLEVLQNIQTEGDWIYGSRTEVKELW